MIPILRKLYGSAVVAATLRGQTGLPYWPRPRIDELRDRRVRDTVAHAARHVPHYRDWFAREGLDPREIRCAADLERLPLLDRDEVRAHPRRFLAETAAAREALSFMTSGTTGSPLEVFHDRRSLLQNIAFGERERAPVNRLCGAGFRPKEVYVGYETSTFKKVIAFYQEGVLFPVRPQRRFVSLLEPPETIASIVEAERPDVLVGYGGWIDLFFKMVSARGLNLHRPKLVMYMGEALPPGARQHIESQFGIPVLSRYNAVESFKIGYYCESRTGFHLHEDLCHVRIVRPDGTPAAPGEQGRIVISNLVNRASVLLNYPIGDMASISPDPCACGRSLRLLSELEGREEDMLTLDGGGFLHPRAIWQAFKDSPEVLQYQLTQHEPLRFELSLVTLDDEAFDRALIKILPRLHALLSDSAHIEARRIPAFDRSSRQKFRAVVSRCPRP